MLIQILSYILLNFLTKNLISVTRLCHLRMFIYLKILILNRDDNFLLFKGMRLIKLSRILLNILKISKKIRKKI